MILDSSAIIALARREPGLDDVLQKLIAGGRTAIGAPTLVETGIILEARMNLDARALLERLLTDFEIATIHFADAHWREAIAAFRRYGKGRHPAGMNFGDCLTYAVAKLSGEPLLCTGDDFPRTDLDLV
ncbi:MAG TPA: type II toxin-antitoxin system VapC family toxin [Thermoanaerobaculia bacterium]|nr:type II toxin-antitoxin system VapC family toxin [Thermoanaerobaculia bacterium]